MKKMLFIMNPSAGQRRANRVLTEILTEFNRGGYLVTVYITQGRGDAKQMVSRVAKDMDIVVCCGGDGTFNEAVSGLLESGVSVPIGYLPAGSTNDFANSLQLQSNLLDAAREIVEGSPSPFDLGRFNDRYFSYVASFGAFTKASYATPQTVKNALGHTAYILSGIQELSQIRTTPVRLEVDGQVYQDKYIFGAVCNCTSMGGVLTLKPELVDMRDGLFEILLVRAPKDLAELGECLLAMQRKDFKCRMMTFITGKKIRVEMENACDWSLDGEKAEGQKVLHIENLHHAYQLVKKVEA